jgi:excisionase family DNA binding protein
MLEKQTITPHEAAKILGIHYGMLLTMLDEGTIPARYAGARRKLLLSDVVAFHKKRNRNRRNAFNKLADAIEAAGLYEATYTGDASSVEH